MKISLTVIMIKTFRLFLLLCLSASLSSFEFFFNVGNHHAILWFFNRLREIQTRQILLSSSLFDFFVAPVVQLSHIILFFFHFFCFKDRLSLEKIRVEFLHLSLSDINLPILISNSSSFSFQFLHS